MKIVAIGGADVIDSKLVKKLRDPVTAAIIGGVVLAIIVFVIIPGAGFNEFSLARWLHIPLTCGAFIVCCSRPTAR